MRVHSRCWSCPSALGGSYLAWFPGWRRLFLARLCWRDQKKRTRHGRAIFPRAIPIAAEKSHPAGPGIRSLRVWAARGQTKNAPLTARRRQGEQQLSRETRPLECQVCASQPQTTLGSTSSQESSWDRWANLVDLVGIEHTTSSMPWKRAPSCATGPHCGRDESILAYPVAIVKHTRQICWTFQIYELRQSAYP